MTLVDACASFVLSRSDLFDRSRGAVGYRCAAEKASGECLRLLRASGDEAIVTKKIGVLRSLVCLCSPSGFATSGSGLAAGRTATQPFPQVKFPRPVYWQVPTRLLAPS